MEPLDYHVASRASNFSFRTCCLVQDALDDGFSKDDLRCWFDEAMEYAHEDENHA